MSVMHEGGDTGRAMSQENVEVVHDSLKAFADRGLDAMAEFWDADINWRAIEGAPDDVDQVQDAGNPCQLAR